MQNVSAIKPADAFDRTRARAASPRDGDDARPWAVGQRSETGYVRGENQDRMSWIRARAADIFVISDGMGGHAGGAAAAALTVQVLQEELQGLDSVEDAAGALDRALQAANAAVHARGQTSNPALAGMGATAVVLLAAGPYIMLAHVGDSRAYRLDRRGALHRLTKDHSVVQRLVDAGTLTQREATHHPDAPVLERALGQAAQVSVEVGAWLTLAPGELCMLCSDGLCGYVDDDAIAAALCAGGSPQALADDLLALALQAGGEDNITVQVLRYGEARPARCRRWLRSLLRGALALAAMSGLAAAGWFGIHIDMRSMRAAFMRLAAIPDIAPIDARLSALEHAQRDADARNQRAFQQIAQQLDALHRERDKAASASGGSAARKQAAAQSPAPASRTKHGKAHAAEAGAETNITAKSQPVEATQ